uniref:Uncharacterized protein n=1 Tax=Lygus hesperus TaxID=30085 RepID=A0A0A9XCK3_LYGHE
MELVAFGTQEGKVKVGVLKANKAQTLYAHNHAVVALTTSLDRTKLLCGHLDGAIFVYNFDASADSEGKMSGMGNAPMLATNTNAEAAGARRIIVHPCPPQVLAWGEHVIVGGADCAVTFYNPQNGHKVQSREFSVRVDGEITSGACNPSGTSFVSGSRDKLRVFNFNIRSRKWEEGVVVDLPNSYTLPLLRWKDDGSRLCVATLTGAVEMFDTCMRRYRVQNNAFELTYVCHNQVIVRRMSNGTQLVLRSAMGHEITKVHVQKERFLVAHTPASLLVGDLITCQLS